MQKYRKKSVRSTISTKKRRHSNKKVRKTKKRKGGAYESCKVLVNSNISDDCKNLIKDEFQNTLNRELSFIDFLKDSKYDKNDEIN